jgi:hypothetical protein
MMNYWKPYENIRGKKKIKSWSSLVVHKKRGGGGGKGPILCLVDEGWLSVNFMRVAFCQGLPMGIPVCFFWATFRQISTWKIYDFDLCKGILMKEMGPNSPDFEIILKKKLPDFYDKFL